VKIVDELDIVDLLNHFNAQREQQSIKAQDELINCFNNFDRFPADTILEKILSIELEHWHQTLRCHPGYKARDTLQALIRLKKLVVQTVIEMHQHYDAFQEAERANEEVDERERERVSDLVLKELITFVALGSALVATARRHKSSRPDIADAVEEAMQRFFSPQISHFVKCLRNNHQHIRFHPTHWEVTKKLTSPPEATARFFLIADELLQTGEDWDSEAKNYLQDHKKIDPYEIAAEYARASVILVDELEKLNVATPSAAVEHLKDVERKRDGWAACQTYKIMLQPFEKRTDFDPYSYLPKIFSEDELRIIAAFPRHSESQVDQMILMKDKWGMCDDELRNMFYRFFRVKGDSASPGAEQI
jgi:hypothetical protein